ncbi:AP-4 complex accessory subunit Tepsin-like isoform X2 [Corticium candelabrum]|uniref:AP-4 complex accessory subunit Tepsin-like isoform X2 n=1 Tax=Corticium candelabrum TaxID=121492 RepID=UPI002E35A43C|nr:AP-4 complex accessory subunit Tepsin-like isoform X2 [Corticium candelabrum]
MALQKLMLHKHWPMLSKATSNDGVPTPGYLLTEIAKLTRESPQTCAYVEDFLVDKLKSSSADVKLKALKIMIFTCDNGSSNFRFDIRRRNEQIRNCTTFHGPPDALRGNAQYTYVREAASKLMETLFAEVETVKPKLSIGAVSSGSRFSSGERSFRSFSSSQPGRMSSCENPFNKGVSEDKSIVGKFQDKLSGIAHVVHDIAKGNDQKSSLARHESSLLESSYLSQQHTAETEHAFDHSSPQTWSHSHSSSTDTYVPTSASRDDWLQENNLVDDITASGGIRAAPPREKVVNFVHRCKTLNIEKIFEALQRKLQNTDTFQTQIKALFVVEALFHSDIADIEEYVMGLENDLLVICKTGQPTAQTKASKILRELNPDMTDGLSSTTKQTEQKLCPPQSTTIVDITDGSSSNTKPIHQSETSLFTGVTLVNLSGESFSADSSTAVSTSLMFGGMTMKTNQGSNFGASDYSVSASDHTDTGNSALPVDLDFLDNSTAISAMSATEQQTSKEISLMPGLETDSVQQFDPLASSGSVNAVTVSEHSFSSSAPLASVTRPGFVHPVLSPSSVASHYPQVFSGRAPVLAYGLRWSHPVPGSVSVQPMVVPGVGQQGAVRLQQKKSSPGDSGSFQFMSSSKGGAFDFVQDAMKESLVKKQVAKSETNG